MESNMAHSRPEEEYNWEAYNFGGDSRGASDAQIAVLDGAGTIIAVNDNWRTFGEASGAPESVSAGIGWNYLAVCQKAESEGVQEAGTVLTGLQKILDGNQQSFKQEYPCETPREKLWFQMIASALLGNQEGAVVCHFNITEHKRLEEALSQVSETQKQTQELAELQQRLIDKGEAEQLRLAKELHEGPLQQVFGISYFLDSLTKSLPEIPFSASLFLLMEELWKIGQTLQDISRKLRPATLEPFGLAEAVAENAARLQKRHPEVRILLSLTPDDQEVDETVRLALYRIYQIAITNALQHAQASEIAVRFNHDAEFAYLEIQDNGDGFNVPESLLDLARNGQLGLCSAYERAVAAGGRLEVQSEPGKGTLVRAVLPKVPHAATPGLEL
jgi:signal transduction histidine kinase